MSDLLETPRGNQRQATQVNKKNIRDCAYTAGVMDSDGCFVIARTIRNKSKYSQPQVVVELNDTRVINFLFGRWGGGISINKARNRSDLRVNGKKINTSDTFKWYIQTVDECLIFCKKLIPFLKMKKKQAELIVQYCCVKKRAWKRCSNKTRKGKGSWIVYTEQEVKRMDKIYSKLKEEKKNHFQNIPLSVAAAENKRQDTTQSMVVMRCSKLRSNSGNKN